MQLVDKQASPWHILRSEHSVVPIELVCSTRFKQDSEKIRRCVVFPMPIQLLLLLNGTYTRYHGTVQQGIFEGKLLSAYYYFMRRLCYSERD